jgi:bifunctional non-homologous end joining protein LigD
MKATSARLPVGPGWMYELKWDGMRAIVEVVDGVVRLWSGRGTDVTAAFPEIAAMGARLGGPNVVLDGELVALDEAGRPSFERLQHRMHVTSARDAARRAQEVPVALVLFDVLRVGPTVTMPLPWRDRRAVLESLADDLPPGAELAGVFSDGPELLEAATRRGMEGVIAKRVDTPYAEGRRSPDWVKVKVRQHQEVVIGGWADEVGTSNGRLGALLVGYFEPAEAGTGAAPCLRYGGRVGSGLTNRVLDDLRRRLAPLAVAESPFDPPPPRERSRDAHFVRPELVAEVSFSDWTVAGIMRHPVYLGLRPDKRATDVVREP